MTDKMKYLITGASGFIGRNFLKKISLESSDILCVGRLGGSVEQKGFLTERHSANSNLTPVNYKSTIHLKQLVQDWASDSEFVVVHLASKFVAKHETLDIRDLINSNIRFGTEILEAVSSKKCKMFINVCSAWQNIDLYPKGDSLYSYTKNAFIEILNYYTKSAKLNVKNLYLYDNYGEDDNRGKIIELLIKSAIMDTSINLRSKNQLINLLHIEDVTRGILALQNGHDVETNFRLNAENWFTLEKVVAQVELIHGKPLRVNWNSLESRNFEPKINDLNFSKPALWSEQISISDGLNRVYDYWKTKQC